MDWINFKFSELGGNSIGLVCKLLEDTVLFWFPSTLGRAMSERGWPALKELRVGFFLQGLILTLPYNIQVFGPALFLAPLVIWKTLIYVGRGLLGFSSFQA